MKEKLIEKLKEFRRTHSGKNRPAFMMYSDKVMEAIIDAMPNTLEELYKVKGVRSDFVNTHGLSVLRILRAAK